MSERPYTPESLGERWSCSPEAVRKMLASERIKGFKLGKLWRIPAHEVQRIEACETSISDDTEASTPQSGTTKQDVDNVVRLARMTEPSRLPDLHH
jgi:hypothetical protein